LRQRWREGCCNAAQLTRELRMRGFTGSYCSVYRRVAHWDYPEIGQCAESSVSSLLAVPFYETHGYVGSQLEQHTGTLPAITMFKGTDGEASAS